MCAIVAYVISRVVFRFNVRLNQLRDIGSLHGPVNQR